MILLILLATLVAGAFGFGLIVISNTYIYAGEGGTRLMAVGIIIMIFSFISIICLWEQTPTKGEIVTISYPTSHKPANNFHWCVPGKPCEVTKP